MLLNDLNIRSEFKTPAKLERLFKANNFISEIAARNFILDVRRIPAST